ncbi:MAG TPA: peptidoglycan DD-metalloendopeptidase family protein [Vicinamibacterales bacterium]|nr:peptidoglycan DD-metalloendopeptidase family protein [Vicinamibacterales bacterium]
MCLAAISAACAQETPVRRTQADLLLPNELETITARVPRNATLDSLLRQHQLAVEFVDAAVRSATTVFNPRALRAERPYKLVRSFDGVLREFEYQIDADNFLRILNPDHRRPGELTAEVVPIEKDTTVESVRAVIDARTPSLIGALTQAGERIQLALALADIFSGSIDFNSGLQVGDSFEVVFEKSRFAGEFAGYGAILGARFINDGREHFAFRWTDPASGKPAYYDENGRSLRRFFLKSPLLFNPRITSGFSLRRLHPVHGTYRPHLGVDYGAPTGSPVVAVASGVVVSAGWAGAGGNQVVIRHASGYESYYLHLSRFGKGIRAGARVGQGEVIGYVGATGTATGPHLDYRLRKNGVFVNPIAEHGKLPPGEPLAGAHLAEFRRTMASVQHRMVTMLAESATAKPDAVRATQ